MRELEELIEPVRAILINILLLYVQIIYFNIYLSYLLIIERMLYLHEVPPEEIPFPNVLPAPSHSKAYKLIKHS
jgi:hypothetical protein